jgi:hypothetical protein
LHGRSIIGLDFPEFTAWLVLGSASRLRNYLFDCHAKLGKKCGRKEI